MTAINTNRNVYRRQLDHWTRRMAVGSSPLSAFDSTNAGTAEGVREFIDGNVEKRTAKLTTSAGCLPEMCPAWDDWVAAFIRSIPPPAYSTAVSDGLRLLRWIRFHVDLDPEQRDAVEGQRSRLLVEQRVRRDRAGYLEFSRRFREAQEAGIRWNENDELRLNPSCTPALLRTRRFLDPHTEVPARVLSYAVNGGLHTTVLEGIAMRIVGVLWPKPRAIGARLLTVAANEWEDCSEAEMIEALEELAQSGIVTFIPSASRETAGR
jgi:hypothetical protein